MRQQEEIAMNADGGSERRGRRSRGLATLELVLSLPILLFVMALMVNFGTVASWKIRALSVGRYSVWENRSPRSTANFLRSTVWPSTASMGSGGLAPAATLDGPRVTAPPLGPIANVIPNTDNPSTDVMNPTLQLLQGSAHLTRQFPMLGKLGPYNLNAQTQVLDNTWDFGRMGLVSNTALRIPLVYTLAPVATQQAWADVYSRARQAILDMIFGPSAPGSDEPAIWPLDREKDFATYGQVIRLVNPNWSVASPDFQPRLEGFCSLDKSVADEQVYGLDSPPTAGLIDRIQGNTDRNAESVAKTMTRAFINLYTQALQASKQTNTPVPGDLQQNINTLNQFLQTLQ
jgi:hypothetical protein